MLGIGYQKICGIKVIFRTVGMERNHFRKRDVELE
jgi:hypothetical protein